MKKTICLMCVLLMTLISYADDLNDLKKQAASGDPAAQYELARYYIYSENINYIEALDLLRKSSKQGNNDAKKLIKELAEPGYDGWGDFMMDPIYDYGILSQDMREILEEYATKGCGAASCEGHKGNYVILGHSCFHSKEYSKAVDFYKSALTEMNSDNVGYVHKDERFQIMEAWMDAYTMLGYCYEHGLGVTKDLKKAMDYYLVGGVYLDKHTYDISGIVKILKETNNPELIDYCYIDNTIIQHYDGYLPCPYADRPLRKPGVICIKLGQYDLAKDFIGDYSKPIQDLSVIENLWIGEMYYKGLGYNTNYSTAFDFFNFICNVAEGPWGLELRDYYPDVYADACYRLYECYAYGRGVEKNAEKAEKYFKQALRFGSSSAIYDDQKHYEITNQ